MDERHALIIMRNESAAREALRSTYADLKLRSLTHATPESKSKAKKCTEQMLPYKKRPETSVGAARRLVGRHLGIKVEGSKEDRDEERRRLKEARDQKNMKKKQTHDVWEGNVQ